MKTTRPLRAAACVVAASLVFGPASALDPKSFTAPGADSYAFDLAWGEVGTLPDQFNLPEAIDVDRFGHVWVADTNNHRVLSFDADGSFRFSFGATGSGNGQLNAPRGLHVDAKRDQIWVSDSGNNRVQKFDLKGNFLCKSAALNAPRGLAVRASTGDLYVSNAGVNTIVRMSGDCITNGGWGGPGSGNSQFNQPVGVAVDAAGQVYVADYTNNRIQKFDADGNFLAVIGEFGTGDTRYTSTPQLNRPAGLDIDASGDLLVTEASSHRVQKLHPDGTVVTHWGALGAGKGQLNNPLSVAADSKGRVFVVDANNYRIVRFSPSTTDQSHLFIDAFGDNGAGNGQFKFPGGIAVDPATGFVYVADNNNHRVQVFDAAGAYQYTIGSPGAGNGQFNIPAFVAIDSSSGALYVTDSFNNRVQKFDAAGAFVTTWGTSGTASNQVTTPQGIAVDPISHDVYVADFGNHRVMRYTENGAFVRGIGNGTTWTGAAPTPASGNVNSAFYHPAGVAVDASGNLYVTENYGQRVQKFDANGNVVLKWGGTGTGSAKGQFNYPQGITIDGAGSVYVADTSNNRVQRFTGDGRYVHAFGSGGSVAPVPGGLFANPMGMAFSANGNLLYVTDRANHRVQRFQRFGFDVTPTPASRTIAAGGTATFDLSTKVVGGNPLGVKVAFKILSGRPPGATATFSHRQLKPGAVASATQLTIATDAGTAARTFRIPVEIEGGNQTRIVTLTLKVTSP